MADKTVSSADPTYSIMEEVTPGVTPAVATRYELPTSSDQAPPTFSSAEVASTTKRPGRASNGSQQGMSSGEWSAQFRFQKSEFMDLYLKSALGGEWASNKLSAGKKDTFFSVVTELRANEAVDPAPANGLYYLDAGHIVNNFELAATAGEGVTATFGSLFLNRALDEENHASSVAAVNAAAREFKYDDLKNVKLTGPDGIVDLGVSSLNLTVGHEREIRAICGQQEGVDIGTSGSRTVNGTITLYRQSFDINSDVTGAPQKFSFEVTRNGVGYRVTVPAAIFQKPTDSLSGSSVLVTLTFTGSYETTAATDIFIERI